MPNIPWFELLKYEIYTTVNRMFLGFGLLVEQKRGIRGHHLGLKDIFHYFQMFYKAKDEPINHGNSRQING